MDCERFDKTTMELLYGELDELSEAAAMRHLHHCTRCRDIWGHLRTTKELSVLPQEAPPRELFSDIMSAEENAQKNLPVKERFSRVISILAGYAMRPQLAMAALLLLMIGSSLVFVRATPQGGENVAVTERGAPFVEQPSVKKPTRPMVYEGETDVSAAPSETASAEPAERGAPEKVAAVSQPEKKSESTKRQAYSEAMVAYQEGRYAEAERLFSEVALSGAEQAASAALHEGHAARNGSGCQRAAALYDSVAAKYPGGTVADEALWHAASCYRAMGQKRRAMAHYRKLAQRPAYSERAAAALKEIEETLVAAGVGAQAAKGAQDASVSSESPGERAPSGAASRQVESSAPKPAAPADSGDESPPSKSKENQ